MRRQGKQRRATGLFAFHRPLRFLAFVALWLSPVALVSLAAETLTGTVYRDTDLDGVHGPQEPTVPGARVVLYGPEGRIVAQAVSGEDGSYRLTGGTAPQPQVRLTVAGLGGRWAVGGGSGEALQLSGATGERRVDLGLVEVGRLAEKTGPSVGSRGVRRPRFGAEKAGPTAGPVAGKAFFGGLPYPNAGPWVTFRCVGNDGVFNFESATSDDNISGAFASNTKPPYSFFALVYEAFGFIPAVGERCRVLLPGEVGAVEPPPPPPDPGGG